MKYLLALALLISGSASFAKTSTEVPKEASTQRLYFVQTGESLIPIQESEISSLKEEETIISYGYCFTCDFSGCGLKWSILCGLD